MEVTTTPAPTGPQPHRTHTEQPERPGDPEPHPDTLDWPAAHAAIQVVSGKWVIPVLAALADGPRTHTDLHRAVGTGVSTKVLTETLRRMQDAGLLTRETDPATASGPYKLTSPGRTLLGPLDAIAAWHRRADLEHTAQEGDSRPSGPPAVGTRDGG